MNFRVCLKFYYFAPSGKRVTQQVLFYFTQPALLTGRQATSTSVVKVFPDFDGTYLTVFDRLWTSYSGHETSR
ncbi:MAG: hypothetical protein WAT22_13610 [Saprospiraceae bacterium]